MSMIGYKALNKDFTAYNGFKYEIGKIYKLSKDEKLEIYKCGFHFCKNPIDVYGYYPDCNNTIIVVVEALGEIIQEGTKYVTDKINISRVYCKEELKELIGNGKINSGDYNSGNYNTGSYNSGNYNSGNANSGSYNSGNYNSGNNNTGNYNSGNANIGSHNSGDHNNGESNTGWFNNGKGNAGHFNAGNHNTGWFNIGNRNTGIFNTGDYKMISFNKETDITINEFLHSLNYDFYDLCRRIYSKNLSPEDKERIEALPNYDPAIFTEITGIKFDECKNTVEEEEKEECNVVDAGNTNELIVSLINEVKSLREEIKQLKNKEE